MRRSGNRSASDCRRNHHDQPHADRRRRAGESSPSRPRLHWSRRARRSARTTVDEEAIAQPADQRPALSGFHHADADGAGRYQPRPALLRRPARHQLERQHRRRGLQPAVLRRHPRRRALEQRLHRSAGSRCRSSRSSRPATRQSSAGRPAAWSTPSRSPAPTAPRLALLRQPQPDWAEKNAFGQNAAPTQQQYGGSIGGPVAENRLFYFAAAECSDLKNTARVVFNLTGITPDQRQRRSLQLLPLARKPFDTTNDARRAPRTRPTTSCRVADRLSRPLQLQQQQGAERERHRQRALRHDRSARSRTTARRTIGRTRWSASTRPHFVRTSLLEARGQFSREKRPRDANALSRSSRARSATSARSASSARTTSRTGALQLAANMTWRQRQPLDEGRHRVQPRRRVADVRLQPVRHLDLRDLPGDAGNPLGRRPDGQPLRLPRTASYRKQMGNLASSLATDELALFAQDATGGSRLTLTLNYGLRWEGAFNPTPEANNDFMLNQPCTASTFQSARTVDPTQIPDQMNQFAPRVGFCLGSGELGHHRRSRLQRDLLRAHADADFLGSDERLPGSARQPFGAAAVSAPGATPTTRSTSSCRSSGSTSIRFRSEQPAAAHDRSDHAIATRSASPPIPISAST